jgi:nucleoside-diphosphate-sugar epimerase
MRILVIGGTGFLGPFIVRRLVELGHHVTVFHRGEHEPTLPFGVRHVHEPAAGYPVLRFPPDVTELALDVVIHMTAMGEADALAARETFRGVARRIVVLSSGDVYRAYGVATGIEAGPIEPEPLTETSPLRTSLYPYKGSGLPIGDVYEKILAERALSGDPALPVTILRLPAVYGPGDPQRRFSGWIRRFQDRRGAIPLGRGYAGWRWTHGYVENVARAIVLATTHEYARGRTYNVGEPSTPAIAERLRRLGEVARWGGKIVEVADEALPPPFPMPLDFRQNVLMDSRRIREDLNFREIVSEAEGLGRTILWEQDNPEKVPLGYDAEDRALSGVSGTAD